MPPRLSRSTIPTAAMFLGLTALLGGCATWRIETAPPAELVTGPKPVGSLRVTRQNGERIMVTSPRVMSDTLVGFNNGNTVGVPLGDVRELATRHTSTGKTLGLIFGTAAVILLTIGIIAGAATSGGLAGY